MPLYDPLIPQPTDLMNASQSAILNNFTTANTSFGINHYPFDNATSNNGKHKFVDMPVGSIPTIASGDGGLYTKTSTGSQLFYTPDNSTNEYQMTRCIAASFARFSTNTAYAANHIGGFTFLPGGMLLQYGLRSSPGSSGQITFPIAFTNAPYSVNVSLYRASGNHNVVVDSGTSATTTTLNYICDTSGSVGVYWWAIGV